MYISSNSCGAGILPANGQAFWELFNGLLPKSWSKAGKMPAPQGLLDMFNGQHLKAANN